MNRKSSSSKVGFDSKILLKLIVIVLLAVAVHQMWNYLKVAREERDRENLQIIADSKAAKEKAIAEAYEKRASELAARREARGNSSSANSRSPQKVETPKESLARLRSKLKSGSRVEMPIGSVRKGDADYFLVEEPMTWPAASTFAEDHGACLTVPTSDLTWLPSDLTKDRSFWIGAARSGSDAWTLVDGTAWVPDKGIAGSGQFVSMGEGGSLSHGDETILHPFVMQWRNDGSNPGELNSQLQATNESLKGSAPVFPPGTVSLGDRHFLNVFRPVSWDEANKFAESAGGNLMVVSDVEEASQLEEITKNLRSTEKIWLGGFLKDDHWSWVTGEPWKKAKWGAGASASRNGYALITQPIGGWNGLDADDKATGFIIEWSDDAAKSSGTVAPATPGNGVDGLVAKARELVVAADQKRKDALAANIKKLKWDLDAHIRGLTKSENELWGPQAELLKECVEASRLQPQEIRDEEIEMSQYMNTLVDYHTEKQNSIDDQFIKEAGFIRDSFIVKMTEIQEQANASGQIKIVTDASKLIDGSRSLEGWVKGFGLVFKPEST